MKKTKRKLRRLIIFNVIIICLSVLLAQNSGKGESRSTKSVWQFFMEHRSYLVLPGVDGYFWRKTPKVERLGYIMGYARGFEEGTVVAWFAATGDTQLPFDVLLPGIDYEELTEAVDEFYSDYANRGIYLTFALPIIICRIGGYIPDEEAKKKIQKARRTSSRARKTR